MPPEERPEVSFVPHMVDEFFAVLDSIVDNDDDGMYAGLCMCTDWKCM